MNISTRGWVLIGCVAVGLLFWGVVATITL